MAYTSFFIMSASGATYIFDIYSKDIISSLGDGHAFLVKVLVKGLIFLIIKKQCMIDVQLMEKYRCHRKHLLAREAEAASWSQRRQMYSGIMKRGAVDVKININPNTINNWQTTAQYPTIVGNGYPPPPPPPPPHHHQMHMHMHMHMQMQMQTGAALMRPLHVWGHPHSMQVDRPQLVPVWPRHLSPPPWLPLRPTINGPPIPDPISYHKALAQGTPCFPPQLVPTMRFQAPPVPGIPPPHAHALFRVPSQSQISSTGANSHSSNQYSNSQPHQLDTHPSNEKIDAAIEDVLAKPWSPLPLGLKPPSLESVMVELQRQGVSNIVPPTYSG